MNVQEKGGKSYFELLVNSKFEICKEIGFKYFFTCAQSEQKHYPITSLLKLICSIIKTSCYLQATAKVYLFFFLYYFNLPHIPIFSNMLNIQPTTMWVCVFFSYLAENFLVDKFYIQPVGKADTATFPIAGEYSSRHWNCVEVLTGPSGNPRAVRGDSQCLRCCFHFLHSSPCWRKGLPVGLRVEWMKLWNRSEIHCRSEKKSVTFLRCENLNSECSSFPCEVL